MTGDWWVISTGGPHPGRACPLEQLAQPLPL